MKCYKNIITEYYAADAYTCDTTVQTAYSFHSPAVYGCSFVSYEDETSISAKAAPIAEKGLGGTIIWAINQGDLPTESVSKDPLMALIERTF